MRQSRAPSETPPEEAAQEPCVFCEGAPEGSTGHAGLAQGVTRIRGAARGYREVVCAFCETHWARRRLDAMTYEWVRVAK